MTPAYPAGAMKRPSVVVLMSHQRCVNVAMSTKSCYAYDNYGQEWLTTCGSGSCPWLIYTPNLKEAKRLILRHTRAECAGGY